jgi:hypothetical protein
MIRCSPLLGISLLWVLASPVGADIALVPGGLFPTANVNALAGPAFGGGGSDLEETDFLTSILGSITAAKDGNTATHSYTVNTGTFPAPVQFKSDYTSFVRTATVDHRATAESIYHFTVSTPTMYSISGNFSVADAIGTTIPGIVELEAELFEFSSSAFIPPPGVPPKFYNHQKSVLTLNEAFGIGGMGGDDTNVLAGSPVGMLLPGKGYRYRTLVTINALSSTNGIASALGTQSIDFTAVPEPTSAGILLFAGMTLTQMLRRTRRGSTKAQPTKASEIL